ncbi:insulin-like growth factor-binding protein complex acid labile subunit [Cataglyphis hispanica]|uniref:insulin-like growth factor-binding protein complex acid labile subunit n=1 Tax=Cataglyphis hispanica TaxID=1086592 RepID=UPI0021801B57|nr:insulin-like growth factor-binding protein complex acid labile subunit [Cataglyphis hispanica]
MALGRKIILFVLITAHLAKTEYDFKNDFEKPEEVQKTRKPFTVNPPTGRDSVTPNLIYPTINSPIYPTNTIRYPPDYSDLSFRFSDVGLQRIGRNFIKSSSIISLSLDNNNISNISPFAFRSMQNLRHLNLSGNRIPMAKLLLLNGNNNLQTLIINNNNGTFECNDYSENTSDNTEKILKDYEIFPSLEHLHLCNNQLRNIDVPFYIAMPILTHLHLSNNSLSSSSAIFDNIPASLTHLKLNKNLIDRVAKDKLRYLKELDMSDNKITQVCFEECQHNSISLRGAFRMESLFLSRNQISEVSSDAFNDMEHLLNLDLSGNEIADLPKDTFNNTIWIINLSLDHNILSTIPNVCSLLNLKNLNLTANRINAIPSDTFCHLQRLEHLYLSNNMITTIETRAFNLQSLRYLDLSGNQLRQLPAQWIFPWQIQELHFERNYFTELNNLSLTNIKSLRNIYLDENPMPKLKAESFQSLPGYTTLHLKNIRVNETQIKCAQDNDDDDNDNDDDNNNDYID